MSFYEMVNMIDPKTGAKNKKMADVFNTGDYSSRALFCVEKVKMELGVVPAE